MKTLSPLLIAATLLAAGPALSHIVLDQGSAPAGSNYRAVFRVGHGCDGLPTTGITVQIPPGVQGAQPQPKPGWVLAVQTARLAQPYTSHGRTVSEDVAEIRWTAASPEAALPSAFFDEFVLRATLPATPGPLWFKVVQACGDGQRQARADWTQVPAEGLSTQGLKTPAALLQVEPGAAPHAHH